MERGITQRTRFKRVSRERTSRRSLEKFRVPPSHSLLQTLIANTLNEVQPAAPCSANIEKNFNDINDGDELQICEKNDQSGEVRRSAVLGRINGSDAQDAVNYMEEEAKDYLEDGETSDGQHCAVNPQNELYDGRTGLNGLEQSDEHGPHLSQDTESSDDDEVDGRSKNPSVLDIEDGSDSSHNSDDDVEHDQFQFSEESLCAVLLNIGSHKLRRKQYELVRTMMNSILHTQRKRTKLPSDSMIRRRIRPVLKSKMFTKSDVVLFPVNFDRSGAKSGTGAHHSQNEAPVMICKPSEWALKDFYTSTTREAIWERTEEPKHHFGTIESLPIATAREELLSSFSMKGKHGVEALVRRDSTLSIDILVSDELLLNMNSLGIPVARRGCVLHTEWKVKRVSLVSEERDGNKCTDELYEDRNHARNGDIVIKLNCEGFAILILRPLHYEDKHQEFRQLLKFKSRRQEEPKEAKVLNVLLNDDLSQHYFRKEPSKGILEDGSPYYVYRFALFTDGFSPYGSRQASFDGCYLILLGIPPENRTPSGVIRRICLCPPGISSSAIITHIIDDIVNGTIHGVEATDGDRKVRIFLDLVVYVGDNPALTELCRTMGHNARSPCHLCFFRKHDTSGSNAMFTHTTCQNSGCLFLRRSGERCESIVKSGCSTETLALHGLKPNDSGSMPLLELSNRLKEERVRIPKNSEGVPVVPGLFDPYRSCAISVDHVFLGISQNIINSTLKLMSPKQRALSEKIIADIYRSSGIQMNSSVFSKDRTRVKPLTISEIYSLVCIYPEVVKTVLTDTYGSNSVSVECRNCMETICSEWTELVSATLHSHVDSLDGKTNMDEKEFYLSRVHELRNKGSIFVQKLHEFGEMNTGVRAETDKPNVHRLVELYEHTLPMFPNINFILELMMERGHQELKRALKQSNFLNPQLQAMETSLANDWICRVSQELKNSRNQQNEQNLSSVRRLFGLCGEDMEHENFCSGSNKKFFHMLASDMLTTHLYKQWEPIIRKIQLVDPQHEESFTNVRSVVEKWFCTWEPKPTVKYRDSVRWAVRSKSLELHGNSRYLRKGSVLQCLSCNADHACVGTRSTETALECAGIKMYQWNEKAPRTFFECQFFVEVKKSDGSETYIYAFAHPFLKKRDDCLFRKCEVSILLELCDRCRPALKIHSCWNSHCYKESHICHNIIDNPFYVLKGRKEGFPPRSA